MQAEICLDYRFAEVPLLAHLPNGTAKYEDAFCPR